MSERFLLHTEFLVFMLMAAYTHTDGLATTQGLFFRKDGTLTRVPHEVVGVGTPLGYFRCCKRTVEGLIAPRCEQDVTF